MIYYPLGVLMKSGISEILIITTPHDAPLFKNLLGDGSSLGCKFEYAIQDNPEGLPQAFIIGEKFIGDDDVALILGDNIFYGNSTSKKIKSYDSKKGALVFALKVSDPSRYGVVEFNNNMKVLSIEEKPVKPKSKFVLPGLYVFDNSVIKKSKEIIPSDRGELEITSLIQMYLDEGSLFVKNLERGTAWFDTGTFSSLLQASQFIETIEENQGVKVGCIEEIAYEEGYINLQQLKKITSKLNKSGYAGKINF
jgi:glucose-1-phosphate thymidylyltransferase